MIAGRPSSWPRGIVSGTLAIGGPALALATLVLAVIDRYSPPDAPLPGLPPGLAYALRLGLVTLGLIAFPIVAGLLIWHHPKSAFTWALAGAATGFVTIAFAQQYAIHALLVAPGSLPLADVAARVELVLRTPLFICGIAAILLFPTGRLQSRRWAIVMVAEIAVFGALALVSLYEPYPLQIGYAGRQPVPVTSPPDWWPIGALLRPAADALFWAQTALAVPIGLSVILRLRGSTGEMRLQIKWFAYAVALAAITFALARIDALPFWNPAPDAVRAVVLWSDLASSTAQSLLLPLAVGIAVFRYRLYDIDMVINRTILFGGLVLFVTIAYGIAVAGIGSVLGQQARFDPLVTIIAIAIVAILLEPVRARLHALANAAVYGKRANPYAVLSEFARGVGRAEPANVLLPRMVDLLRDGTGASSTEVWVRIGDRFQLAASSPRPIGGRQTAQSIDDLVARTACETVPVFHETELLGALAVMKPRGEQLVAVERRLLADLASQAGLVLSRFRLVEELRESRARLIAAEDQERRRIERDLHDGAQQRFVNALLALGMAQTVGPDAPTKAALIADASREVQTGLAELRDLARGLHPPLLTESGLSAAVSSLADRSPIVTTVVGNAGRRFPEPVEVTAYFVVAEALANAAKHSHASAIQILIVDGDNRLRVEVADDGVGGADAGRGSGLTGLKDRTAAIGGTLEVLSTPGHGTVVRADLPCE